MSKKHSAVIQLFNRKYIKINRIDYFFELAKVIESAISHKNQLEENIENINKFLNEEDREKAFKLMGSYDKLIKSSQHNLNNIYLSNNKKEARNEIYIYYEILETVIKELERRLLFKETLHDKRNNDIRDYVEFPKHEEYHEAMHSNYFKAKYKLSHNLMYCEEKLGDIQIAQYFIELKMTRGNLESLRNLFERAIRQVKKRILETPDKFFCVFIWCENQEIQNAEEKDIKEKLAIVLNERLKNGYKEEYFPKFIHLLIGKENGFKEFMYCLKNTNPH